MEGGGSGSPKNASSDIWTFPNLVYVNGNSDKVRKSQPYKKVSWFNLITYCLEIWHLTREVEPSVRNMFVTLLTELPAYVTKEDLHEKSSVWVQITKTAKREVFDDMHDYLDTIETWE